MVFYIFLSVNSFVYYAMTSTRQFFAIMSRYSSVFEMSEYEFKRDISVPTDKVEVKFEGCDFTWGFKIKQVSADADSEAKDGKKKDEKKSVNM